MTTNEEIHRRIKLKKQLIAITKAEIKELQKRMKEIG